MKPLGTITMCFPHVDEETRIVLQSVMEDAENYGDFSRRLCDKVCRESVPPLLNYFAYYHAFNLANYNMVRRLVDAGKLSDLAKPITDLIHGWASIDWRGFQKSISLALRAAPNDWIACHMYLAWRLEMASMGLFPERLTDLQPLQVLESKVNNDKNFSFFLSAINHMKARELDREGKSEEARIMYDRAITMAEKHGCPDYVSVLLFQKANLIKNTNFNEALGILKVQRRISEQLGYEIGLGLNRLALCFIAQAQGKYETAVEHLEEFVKLLISLGCNSQAYFYKCIIASEYNYMRDGAKALEIVESVLQENLLALDWVPHIIKTLALLNLDRIDEAMQSLDLIEKTVQKIGDTSVLFWISFIEGLILKKQGEFASAKYELEEAHSATYFPGTNWTLIQLVDVEIEMFSYRKEKLDADVSGPWMQKLINQVQERDIPGIAAQAMLLKAKFRFKQGRAAEANKLLKKVLRVSATSGMKYLREFAESLVPELFASL